MNINKYLFIIFLFCSKTILNNKQIFIEDEPLLVVSLITQNDESVIVDILKPYVNAGLDTFFIYDLNSTDNTISVINNYFKTNKIKRGFIIQEKLNESINVKDKVIDLIEKQFFPTANYILLLDDDLHIQNIKELLEFCKKNKDAITNNKCYSIRVESPTYETYSNALIKTNSDIAYRSRSTTKRTREANIEHSNTTSNVQLPSEIYFKQISYVLNSDQLTKRKNRYLQQYKNNPTDDNTIQKLSQIYLDSDDYTNAELILKKYLDNATSTDYKYLALYNLGKLMDIKFFQNQNDNAWHTEGFKYYFEAYKLCPHRAEPLVRIAQHYQLIKNWLFAFIFSRNAVNIEYPKNNLFYVEKDLYNFERYHILSISAWLIGQYKTGEIAAKKALQAKPDDEQLVKNLNLYLERNKQNIELL